MSSTRTLTTQEVIDLRHLRKNGWSLRRLAKRYGIHHESIRKIVHGFVYKDIPEEADLPSYGQPRPLIAVFSNGARIIPGQGESVLIEKCPVRIPAGRLFSYVTRTVNLPREKSEVGIIHEGKNDIPVRVQKTRKECEAYPLCAVEWGKGDFLVPKFTGDVL